MSFREMIDAMLSARGAGIDPADVLEQHGMGDLPADAFSSALLHFAERAPLDVADALAPVVTRFSPVPFEPDDLEPSPVDGVIDDGGDVFAALSGVHLDPADVLANNHLGEADPGEHGLDDGDGDGGPGIDDHQAELDDDVYDDDPTSPGDGFGDGHDQAGDLDADDLDADPDDLDGFDARSPLDDALDAVVDFDHDANLVPVDDNPELDTVDDFDDQPDEALHDGLEDLASSMSDMNVEIDRLSHDPSLNHFDL